jgi:predicted aldo/keto reductase-like oxidoreductase
VDYLDLFAFHGMNFEEQFDWVFGEGRNNCLSVVKEYMAVGKIRHLGFSTHGSTDFIMKCINTDVFEYVNIHHHYFGSYTASGGGHDGMGNLDNVKLLKEKDIGTFIISPYDKGGRMYAPSKKLRSLTLPEMEPMTFSSLWLWNHHRIYDENGGAQLHTFTVGAARPSDLDQPAVAAFLHDTKPDETLASVKRVTSRLDAAMEEALGKEWLQSWWMGLPKNTASKGLVEHNQVVWLYNCIKAFGLYDFAKARYNAFEKNEEKWDESLTDDENIAQKIGKNSWGFVPGRPLKPDVDYSDDLVHVPEANKQRVNEAEEFVYTWCRDVSKDKMVDDSSGGLRQRARSFMRRNLKSEPEPDKSSATKAEEAMPTEWETAYDLRVWPDFPDRPSRNL